MSKKIFLFMILAVLVAACGPLGPSVCDDTTEPSVLCDIATKAGVRLESVGNLLIVVNAVAIGEGEYTTDQAATVLKQLRAVVDNPVSYVFFKSKVEGAIIEYPGLFAVAALYMDSMGGSELMYPKDRRILVTWLDNRIRSLE